MDDDFPTGWAVSVGFVVVAGNSSCTFDSVARYYSKSGMKCVVTFRYVYQKGMHYACIFSLEFPTANDKKYIFENDSFH